MKNHGHAKRRLHFQSCCVVRDKTASTDFLLHARKSDLLTGKFCVCVCAPYVRDRVCVGVRARMFVRVCVCVWMGVDVFYTQISR